MTGPGLSEQLQQALARAAESAGAPVAPVSLIVDYVAPDREVAGADGRITRATRSLVFAEASLTAADGSVVAAGSGVFRVLEA